MGKLGRARRFSQRPTAALPKLAFSSHVTEYLPFCSLFHTKVNSPWTETLPQSRYDSLWQGPAAIRACNKRQAAVFNGSPISVTVLFSRGDWGIVARMQEWCSECQAQHRKRHISVTPTTKSARDLGPAVHFCSSHQAKNSWGPWSCSDPWFSSLSISPAYLKVSFPRNCSDWCGRMWTRRCNICPFLSDSRAEQRQKKHFSSPKRPHQIYPF